MKIQYLSFNIFIEVFKWIWLKFERLQKVFNIQKEIVNWFYFLKKTVGSPHLFASGVIIFHTIKWPHWICMGRIEVWLKGKQGNCDLYHVIRFVNGSVESALWITLERIWINNFIRKIKFAIKRRYYQSLN